MNITPLNLIDIVEQAAIASARWMGKGQKNDADQAAVEVMREKLNELPICGRIVTGEGERDEAPMLFVGEMLGKFASCESDRPFEDLIDIAVDPCEGTNLVAYGKDGAMAVMAFAERGGLMHVPDFYMDKLAAPPAAKGKVDLSYTPTKNIQILSECLGRSASDLVIVVMDRPRHAKLIEEIRATGARVRLISDGDVAAALSSAFSGTNIHALMGIGAAPEGIITAAAMRSLGAHFQGRIVYDPATVMTTSIGNSKEANLERMLSMGITAPDKIYEADELASGKQLIFAACGITNGALMKGVRFFGGGVRTETLVISSRVKKARFIDAIHMDDDPKSIHLT